jgi:predicted TIM-barrel fold metal-dependent hydrolase
MDIDSVAAIDIHVHVEQDGRGRLALDDELMSASASYFRGDHPRTPTVRDIAAYYRQRNMVAVIFTVDATRGLKHPPLDSAEIAAEARAHPDTLIPFGSVDPTMGTAALQRARTLVEEFGVKGFKFHPSLQRFEPNSLAYYPLWEYLEQVGSVALFHTGQTGIGAGLPGGRGIPLRFSNPMLLDDIAADFPQLQVVMAHPAVPWLDEQISIATHKANAWIDLSGWSPKYFPDTLLAQINGPLRRKVLFGSDFPVITPDRWMDAASKLPIKSEVWPLLLKENAMRLLGLGVHRAA